MQHFLLQGRLLWLFLPAVAMAIHVVIPGSTEHSTPAGRRSTKLPLPQTFSQINDHPVTCKDPDGPYRFTTGLNRTRPFTPPLPASDFPPGESAFAFDCEINLPGGIIWFEIKGDVGNDLSLVFQVYVNIWPGVPIDLGVFRCSLLDVEKDPCVFNINTKLLVGQAGLFPEQDQDPTKLDLCLKVQATLKLPFTKPKSVNFDKCFITFDKPDDIANDALSPEPVFSNSNATTA